MRIEHVHVKSVPFADDASVVIRIIVVKHTLLFSALRLSIGFYWHL
jgi:hypothetical protein